MSDSDTPIPDRYMEEESSDEETLAQRHQRLRERDDDNGSDQNSDTEDAAIKQESDDNDDNVIMSNPQDRMNEDDDDDAPRRHSHARSSRTSNTQPNPAVKPKGARKTSQQPIFNQRTAQEKVTDAICKKIYDGSEIKMLPWKEMADFIITAVPGSKVSGDSCRDLWKRNCVMHAVLQNWAVPCEWLERCVSNDVPLPEDDNAKACAKKVKEGVLDGASTTIPAATVEGCSDWLDECARAIGGGSNVKKRGRRAAQGTPTDGRGRRVKGKGKQAVQRGKNHMQDEDEDDDQELPVRKKEESGDDEEEPMVKDEFDRDQEIVALRKRVAKLEDMVSKMQQQLNQLMASK